MNEEELFAARMANSGLITPFNDPLSVVENTVGIQSQQQRMAEMNIGLRTEHFQPATLTKLFTDHQVVRTWGQRWTLQLLTLEDWALVIAARRDEKLPNAYYADYRTEIETIAPVANDWLKAQGEISKYDFDALLAQEFPTFTARDVHRYTILQVLAHAGQVVFDANLAYNDFNLISMANETIDMTPEEAIHQLILRYLHAFGPATVNDFAKWAGIKISTVRPVWNQLMPELHAVDYQEKTIYSLDEIDGGFLADTTAWLNDHPLITAGFDASLTGYINKDWFFNPKYQSTLITPNGILHGTIIIHGEAVGRWNYKLTGTQLIVTVLSWKRILKKDRQKLMPQFAKIATMLQLELGDVTYDRV